ncbi:MAG: SurA N-terminal domain-containing protein [Patescibacteria group bacterium]
MSTKKIIIGVIVIVVLVIIGYLVFSGKTVKLSIVDKANNKTSVTADKPSDIAIKINDTVILKTVYDAQLASAIDSLKAQKVDVTNADILSKVKTQVVNDIISNELVAAGIISSGVKPTVEEIETQFQAIVKQAGGEEKFKEELVKSNLAETQLRDNISKQLAVQKYLLQNIDVKSITINDAEISQFYADYSKAQKDAGQKTVPVLKELSAQIKQQITANKQQVLINNFIASLREKAKIEISI